MMTMIEGFNKAIKLGGDGLKKDQEVLCQTHFSTFNENRSASWYCRECFMPLCGDCVLEKHSSHIEKARTKIDHIISKSSEEIKILSKAVTSYLPLISKEDIEDDKSQEQEKKIHDDCDTRHKKFERFLGEIQNIMDSLLEIKKKLLISLSSRRTKGLQGKNLKQSKNKL